ncbi:TspO protein [Brevundimonas sp.]|uniref:TspO protein n=1 Tax=Brevundimonas sp. TaxID=1871086 RepID=UPI002FCA1A1E
MVRTNDLIDTARGKASDLLNADGRDWKHVALGAVLVTGFAVTITILTKEASPDPSSRAMFRRVKREVRAGNLLVPAVFSSNTLSALRVWNAPARRGKTTAMGLWALAQTANAWWLAARPQKRWSQIGAAMTSAGLAAAFAYEARQLNVDAAADPASQANALIKQP